MMTLACMFGVAVYLVNDQLSTLSTTDQVTNCVVLCHPGDKEKPPSEKNVSLDVILAHLQAEYPEAAAVVKFVEGNHFGSIGMIGKLVC